MNDGEHPEAGRAQFEAAASVAYCCGRMIHGDLGLTIEAFRSHLEAVTIHYLGPDPSWRAATQFVAGLHTSDLYLSVACAQKSEDAWQRFRSLYFRFLSEVFWYVNRSRNSASDLADSLLNDMFLPDRSGRSRIASYDGRSALTTWLRVIVNNRLINEKQKRGAELYALETLPEPRDTLALARMEQDLRRSRYEDVVIQALQRACHSLSAEERQILLWRYDDNLRLGEVARLLGIHQSNVTRQIEKLCKKLRTTVLSTLANESHLSDAAIAECVMMAMDGLSDAASVFKALRTARMEREASEAPRPRKRGMRAAS